MTTTRTSPSSKGKRLRTYRTDDLSLACYLWFRGHDLKSMRWEGKYCHFTFESPNDIDGDAKSFQKGSATVSPSLYWKATIDFKRLVYDNQ
jgi:hypothetical protein